MHDCSYKASRNLRVAVLNISILEIQRKGENSKVSQYPKHFTTDKCCALDVIFWPGLWNVGIQSELCIPVLRGLGFVQKCHQLMVICRAVIGKDNGLQLSSLWLLLLWKLVAVVPLERGWSGCLAWRQQQKGCKKVPRLAGHQNLSTSTCNFSGCPNRETKHGE